MATAKASARAQLPHRQDRRQLGAPAAPPACQLYVELEVATGARERLEAVLAAYPLTSVLLAPQAGQTMTAATAKPLVDLAQAKHCAALLADDAALARTLRADGVHLTACGVDDLLAHYGEARSVLGAGAIVGVDVGTSRHLAMELGEAGADYVGFSTTRRDTAAEPASDMATADDELEPTTLGPTMLGSTMLGPTTLDALIAWWAEVFEVPCVAFAVATPAEAADLASSGADFVAVRLAGAMPVAASVSEVLAYAAALEAPDAS